MQDISNDDGRGTERPVFHCRVSVSDDRWARLAIRMLLNIWTDGLIVPRTLLPIGCQVPTLLERDT